MNFFKKKKKEHSDNEIKELEELSGQLLSEFIKTQIFLTKVKKPQLKELTRLSTTIVIEDAGGTYKFLLEHVGGNKIQLKGDNKDEN